MSRPLFFFENEEASKLLDYFVAYKKMMSKVEYIKCVSALNSDVHFCENQSQTKSNTLPTINDNQPAIGLPADLTDKQ